MHALTTIKGFFFPTINRRYVLRVILLAFCAAIVFRYLATPFYIHGESMLPHYRSRGITFGWRLAYLRSEPRRGDLVLIRTTGSRVVLLKRVVALPGETVEFLNGDLFINGRRYHEPYAVLPSEWDLEPRTVDEAHYYVVGDNRSMPINEHVFGQVDQNRIIGKPLW